MRNVSLFTGLAVLLFAACGTSISNIDKIQARLNKNKCRINREELIYSMQDLEYRQDTTFTEIPQTLIDDSLLVCPATNQFYLLVVDGNDRTVICPGGHGESSF
ncbi:MAG: hypothetical protein KAR40_07490 [Candidatus Sabulitectum sp.]|nr:hypothetical protein [Candidatus Sabulitectum sp.]